MKITKNTPKILYKNSSFLNFCKNADIMKLWDNFIQDKDSTSRFWQQLAQMGSDGLFKNNKVFTGLCEIFVEVTKHLEGGKGLQNIRYPEQFSDFVIILASSCPQAYQIFKQNLVGRSIRNIRYHLYNNLCIIAILHY